MLHSIKRLTWLGLLLVFTTGTAFGQSALLQVIHNSPDPGAATVDVYVNDALLLDDLNFREATPFTPTTAGSDLTIAIAPGTSTSSADAVFTTTVNLTDGGTYQAIATGVLDPDAFAANPEGADTGFTLLVNDMASPTSGAGTAYVTFAHGTPDAPTIDVLAPGLGGASVLGTLGQPPLPYGNLVNLTVPTALQTGASSVLQIVPASAPTVIISTIEVDLAALDGVGITVLASGFADPSANQDGPGLKAIAVFGDGNVIELRPPVPFVTIAEINAIPQENIDQLNAGGASLQAGDIPPLIHSAYNNEVVQFNGIVMSDPLSSGLASWNDARGGPGRIHIYVRDPAADSLGVEGMGIQIVDGAYEDNGTLGLIIGDVINITGTVTYFGTSVQVTPLSVQVLGNYTDLGLSDSVLDPVMVTASDLNSSFGDGTFQANWDNVASLNGQFVRFENTTIFNRALGDRPDWSVTDGDSRVYTYDPSLQYRNDRQNSYSDDWNKRDGDFVPPPPGALVNLQGFVVFQGGNDPDGVAIPADAMVSVAPFSADDLEVLESPPVVSALTGPTAIPTDADEVAISIDVVGDPSRTIDTVILAYVTSQDPEADPTEVAMTANGTVYTGNIPAQPDGTYVLYAVQATDNTGATAESSAGQYRVLNDGIQSIADVQMTFEGAEGPSPFEGFTTPMDITATVNSTVALSGILIVQDDADLGGFSGIIVDAASAPDSLQPGDMIRITEATIQEIRGNNFERGGDVTGLGNATIEVLGEGDAPGYKVVTTSVLQDDATAEAHESMMLRFENVRIVNNDVGFGEWSFATAEDSVGILGDDTAGEIFNAGGGPGIFGPWDVRDFIQGAWSHTFGAFKLLPESLADAGSVVNVANEPVGAGVPDAYTLDQNYPNPFNPVTTITYNVGQNGPVSLEIFDITGRRIATLVNDELAAGKYQVTFNALDLSSGMYLYRLQAGNQIITKKMMLLK